MDTTNAVDSTTFLLGHDGSWWDFWMLVSVGGVALTGFLVLIFTAGSVIVHKREAASASAALERYKLETAGKVADAKAEGIAAGEAAGDAKARASEADERASKANERAQQLSVDAERAKQETERIKSLVIWRSISNEAGNLLVNTLREYSGSVTLAYVQVDPEAVSYAAQISKALEFANHPTVRWTVEARPRIYSDRVVTGLHIPDRGNTASEAVRQAFLNAHIPFESDDVPDHGFSVGPMATGPVPVTTDALIIVGSRNAPY